MYKTKPKFYIVLQSRSKGENWKDIFELKTNKKYKLSKTAEERLTAFKGSIEQVIKAYKLEIRQINRRSDK